MGAAFADDAADQAAAKTRRNQRGRRSPESASTQEGSHERPVSRYELEPPKPDPWHGTDPEDADRYP